MRAALLGALLLSVVKCYGDPLVVPQKNLADFQQFFARPGLITMQQVMDHFGEPTKLGPLTIGDSVADRPVVRDHAWWYYQFTPGESVGVMMDEGKVVGASVFHRDHRTEMIRQNTR